jgi:hypothetical protein
MVLTLQSISSAKSFDDTSGSQTPIRDIKQKLLTPLGAFPKAIGRVIFLYTGIFEAPLVIPINSGTRNAVFVRSIIKEGFIHFSPRRHNV